MAKSLCCQHTCNNSPISLNSHKLLVSFPRGDVCFHLVQSPSIHCTWVHDIWGIAQTRDGHPILVPFSPNTVPGVGELGAWRHCPSSPSCTLVSVSVHWTTCLKCPKRKLQDVLGLFQRWEQTISTSTRTSDQVGRPDRSHLTSGLH